MSGTRHIALVRPRRSRPASAALVAIVAIGLLTASALGATTPASGARDHQNASRLGFSAEGLARLDQRLDQYVDDGHLAGGVLLVQRHGEVAYLRAFGQRDKEQGSAMTSDAIFRIASQSKAIVSVATMMLQEQGKLLISDPVSRYLPEFAKTTVAVVREEDGRGEASDPSGPSESSAPTYDVVPAEREITVRDLLTHTAGISYGNGPAVAAWAQAGLTGWYFADRDEPIRETVRRMAALPFNAQPGAEFVYGYSTDILGAVVEVASGEPLDRFLQRNIFEPLGMEDTHFYLPRDKVDRLATVYSLSSEGMSRASDEGTMVSQGHYVEGPRKSFSGGAGLLSTARDYSRFQQCLLNGGELEGRRILSPASVRLMTVNHIGDKFVWGKGTGFGLGFSVVLDLGERGTLGNVGEYAWGGAYHSAYWNDPKEQLTVTYMTNLIPAGPLDDHQVIRALIYSSLIGDGVVGSR